MRCFVELAAAQHAPCFIRFLRMLLTPEGSTIKRNQLLVLSCLNDKEAALLLYTDPSSRQRRDTLIKENDHVTNPRGKLMYHMELVGLLGDAGLGDNATAELQARTSPTPIMPTHIDCMCARPPVCSRLPTPPTHTWSHPAHAPLGPFVLLAPLAPSPYRNPRPRSLSPPLPRPLSLRSVRCSLMWQVREMLPLTELLQHLLEPAVPLPLELHANYLFVLRESYLATSRPCKEVAESEAIPNLMATLIADVSDFTCEVLPTASFAADEDSDVTLKRANFVFDAILPTLAAFYRHHYARALFDNLGLDDPSEEFTPHLAELLTNAQAQPGILPPHPVEDLIQAMQTHGLAESLRSREQAAGASVMAMAEPPEEHPQDHILSFMDAFYKSENASEELSGLIEVFAAGLRVAIRSMQEASGRRSRGDHGAEGSRAGA